MIILVKKKIIIDVGICGNIHVEQYYLPPLLFNIKWIQNTFGFVQKITFENEIGMLD